MHPPGSRLSILRRSAWPSQLPGADIVAIPMVLSIRSSSSCRPDRKLLFTHLRVPAASTVRTAQSSCEIRRPRLWVNGVEQPFEDAVGNLPLAGRRE